MYLGAQLALGVQMGKSKNRFSCLHENSDAPWYWAQHILSPPVTLVERWQQGQVPVSRGNLHALLDPETEFGHQHSKG